MEEGQLKHSLIHAVAGALSGAFSRTVVSPLDLIKIRFQVQLEPTTNWTALRRNLNGPSKYTGVIQATKEIFREEGFRGFWRGNVPALLMVMPYTAIQFGVLHELKSIASRSLTSEEYKRWSPYLSYASGSFAGCAATIGTYPFDLLRTILASQGEPKVHPNMRAAFTDIVKTRGFRGLYIGLSPTIVAIIPYAGLQIGSYDTCKRWIKRWNQYQMSKPGSTWTDDNLCSFQLFLCGVASSTSAKALCHPLDVVKKRIQTQGLKRHQKYGARIDESAYKGMLDALRQIIVAEGMHGLYKGILPSLIKSAPSGALTFVAYEFTSDLLESLLTS